MIYIFPLFYLRAFMEIVLELGCKCASFAFVVYALLYFTYIEITSWKAHAYGIFTRVGEVPEIERVRSVSYTHLTLPTICSV